MNHQSHQSVIYSQRYALHRHTDTKKQTNKQRKVTIDISARPRRAQKQQCGNPMYTSSISCLLETQKEAADYVNELSSQIGSLENEDVVKCYQLAQTDTDPLLPPLSPGNGLPTELACSKSTPASSSQSKRKASKRAKPAIINSESLRRKYLMPKKRKLLLPVSKLSLPSASQQEAPVSVTVLRQILDCQRHNSQKMMEMIEMLHSLQNGVKLLDDRTHPWTDIMIDVGEQARMCHQLRGELNDKPSSMPKPLPLPLPLSSVLEEVACSSSTSLSYATPSSALPGQTFTRKSPLAAPIGSHPSPCTSKRPLFQDKENSNPGEIEAQIPQESEQQGSSELGGSYDLISPDPIQFSSPFGEPTENSAEDLALHAEFAPSASASSEAASQESVALCRFFLSSGSQLLAVEYRKGHQTNGPKIREALQNSVRKSKSKSTFTRFTQFF